MPEEHLIPCAFRCGRSFRRDSSGVKMTQHGAVPEWGLWSVMGLDDETGEKIEYARIRCWICDEVCYPPSWIVEQIKAGSSSDD
ncbi:hypothetical protein [Streptomyces sp. NPDC101206]|uniref:hypothetical protein n=1 Tax=Streptomyces sp. NPDC101206 TaxID=3366128 RepID=UPI00380802AC